MTYSSEVLADSPLAYYRQGEASGTVMTDSSGNTRNGTYTSVTLGTAGLLTGDADTAATYNGTSSLGTVSYAAWMNNAALTVEAIVKTSATGIVAIVDRDYSSSSTRAFQFRLNNGVLEFIKTAGTIVSVSGGSGLNDGARHHVAATYNGTTITLYVDGAAVGTPTAATGDISSTASAMLVGASYQGTTNPSGFFPGVIDEVAYYATALSPTRITAHVTAMTTAAPASSGGTVAVVSGVSGSATGLYPASGTVAATSGVSGSATLVPQSTGGTVQVLSSVSGSATLLAAPRYTFTPPIVQEGSDDPFFGRYLTNVGQSVVLTGGHYVTTPYPWLGELVGLTEGRDYFLGGRVYTIDPAIASALNADGYTTN